VPGSLSHLARRFFDVLFARPLGAEERAEIERWLSPFTAQVFFSQADADQRHGYHAATVVAGAGVDEPQVIRAALLHDVGKRHSGLGVWGRTLASLLMLLRLPLFRRARFYRDHGDIGARELEVLDCERLVIDFARYHHGSRPQGADAATWDLLQRADQPPKPGGALRSRIT
jgi:putative nucleotidyltransferase with HDIG domain